MAKYKFYLSLEFDADKDNDIAQQLIGLDQSMRDIFFKNDDLDGLTNLTMDVMLEVGNDVQFAKRYERKEENL